jgi:hypothetical protein
MDDSPQKLPDKWLENLSDYFKQVGLTPNGAAHALLYYSVWLHMEHGTKEGFDAWVADLIKEGDKLFNESKAEKVE